MLVLIWHTSLKLLLEVILPCSRGPRVPLVLFLLPQTHEMFDANSGFYQNQVS